MQNPEEKTIHGIIEDAKEYVDIRLEHLRMVALEKSTKFMADVITQVTVVGTALLAFLFGSLTLAFYLADVLGSTARGFGCVSLLYLLIAVIVYFTKDKYIETGLVNFMIRKYFKKRSVEEKNDEKRL